MTHRPTPPSANIEADDIAYTPETPANWRGGPPQWLDDALDKLAASGAIVETFTPLLVMDHNATQSVPASSGAVNLAIATTGHIDGVIKRIFIPAGNATSLTAPSDFGIGGDLFDPTKNYLIEVFYFGNTFTAVGRSIALRDTTAPTLLIAKVLPANPAGLVLTFSETVYAPNLVGLSLAFSVGTPKTIIAVASGNFTTEITFTLSAALLVTDVATVTLGSTRTVQDLNGNLATPIASVSITIAAAGANLPVTIAGWRGDQMAPAQFTDDSGNANHLLQATAVNQATFIAADPAINNQPCMEFTSGGTGDDFYICPAAKVGGIAVPAYTEYTVLAVCKLNVSPATQPGILFDGTQAGGVVFTGPLLWVATSGGGQLSFGCAAAANAAVKSAFVSTGWNWILGIHNGATRKLYVNGVLVATNSTADTSPVIAKMSTGRSMDGSPIYPLSGRIAELRVAGHALTAPEITALGVYINSRYGL